MAVLGADPGRRAVGAAEHDRAAELAAGHVEGLGAELMIWSIACMAKLKVMNSTMGRRPVNAAPTPTPAKPCSVIGVSTTRFAPNSCKRPA